ncbi:MAG: NAD(P)/FAD-dependent oxidoreductase [Burkholderiaceae bacterium]
MLDEHDSRLCDIAVIGGGPVGTTAAALLAEKGYSVRLFEQSAHPRFHIGESLLPMNLGILERLGVGQQVRDIGLIKHGAEFNALDPATGKWRRQTFHFARAMNPVYPHAYEVRRSEFDALLYDNAIAKGVRADCPAQVTRVDFSDSDRVRLHVRCAAGEREVAARYLVDASGRGALLSRQLKLREKNPHHQSAAIFGHFANVERRSGDDEGNISIYWFEHGWFWLIPLRDGVTSVGAVCWPEYLRTREGSTEAFLWQTIRMNPGVAERMRDARCLDEVRATGNFSYTSKRMWGPNYMLLGDAFAFVDPVFSSGVYLGMSGAQQAAEVIDQILREPHRRDALCRRFERRMRAAIAEMSWFIYRFTAPGMQQLFMHPRNDFQIESAVISLLAGDIYDNRAVKLRLRLFKMIYAIQSGSMGWRSLGAWMNRRRNVGAVFDRGTMAEDAEHRLPP